VSRIETDDSRNHELERRIEMLERLDERSFGRFTTTDWILCTVFALLLPLLAALWFAP
jgi:hypothetical protein